jgi:ABC-type phosphate transport system substrate-binding protein
MVMIKRIFNVAAISLAGLATVLWAISGQASASSKRELVVIVNKANTAGSISKVELSSIYLGKRKTWATGDIVKPCDLQEPGVDEEQTSMSHFSAKYLNKDMPTLKSYWIKMIFSGKGEPPQVFKKAEDVIHVVSEDPASLGYVYSDQVTGSVRVLPVGE